MRTSLVIFPALFLFIVSAFTPASAQPDPQAFVMDLAQEALVSVNKHRATYDEDPSILQNELLELLDPVIDFEAFARGVMGKFHDQATPAQKAEFQTAFKATLVDLYTSALVASEISAVTPGDTVTPSPTSARVVVNVATVDGASYVVQYNLRYSDDAGWLARNIILDGVNIGLTFRNQFMSAMDSENGDIARVITIWPELIEGN